MMFGVLNILRNRIILPSNASRIFSQPFSTITPKKSFDINTNLTKDLILYKYDNPKYFKYLNMFAISQLVLWTFISTTVVDMKDVQPSPNVTKDSPWYMRINFGEKKFKNTLASFTIILGGAAFFISWTYILRSVRYLILHKGGKDVSLVTYTPFGQNRIMKVPLDHIYSRMGRHAATSSITLKVKNRSFIYFMDIKGEFRNPQLFDHTVGVHKSF